MAKPEESRRLRRILRSGAALIVGAALLSVPAVAAHAVFTASATAQVTASTHVLAAPNPALTVVTATCTGKNKKFQLDITVSSFFPVNGANYHSLTVIDPSAVIQAAGDLSTADGRDYSDKKAAEGVWTYEIRGDYRVPGTANVWKGKTLRGTVACL